MMRERFSIVVAHAENADAQPPDRTGHAIAVKLKVLQAGRSNILPCIHFDAVNNRKKVLFAQAKRGDDLCQPLKSNRNVPGIERVNVVSPPRKQGEPLRARHVVIGNIVDISAKRMHFEHCFSFLAAQKAHCEIKGAAACTVRRRRLAC